MSVNFPSDNWAKAFMDRLNSSSTYAEIAQHWEGDICFVVEPDSPALEAPMAVYMDLWHGTCRQAFVAADMSGLKPAFVLNGPLATFVKILRRQLDPMNAMLTRQLKVKGNMMTLVRNVPTVLEFVKTATQIETEFPE